PFVVVVVAVEHQRGAVGVEDLPEGADGRIAARGAGREAGVVPVGQDAGRRVGGQVAVEPAGLLPAVDVVAVAVEGHEMPGADVVAVPAAPRRPGRGPEVLVVGRGLRGVVVVVAGDGVGPVLERPPGRVVALRIVAGAPVGVGVIADGGHGAGGLPDQLGGVLSGVAAVDVAGG